MHRKIAHATSSQVKIKPNVPHQKGTQCWELMSTASLFSDAPLKLIASDMNSTTSVPMLSAICQHRHTTDCYHCD